MATNFRRDLHTWPAMPLVASDPTTPASGDPVRFGSITGVALTAEGATGSGLAATETTVHFGYAVWDLSVKGVDGSGNSAVAVGDLIYYVDADTPKLSKKNTGYFFGVALETVGSGATATIEVMHVPSPGAGTLGTGTVGTTQLADAGVTAGKLSTTLKTGYIPLDLAAAREIATNDIINAAGNGGILALDTTPIFERVNVATDKKLRFRWAASNSDAITWNFGYPPDLDDAATVIVNILAAMGGATDTPTVAINYFENVGDTNAGGNTAAVTGTSIAQYTRTIAAADVGAYPKAASVELVPGAHTTDTFLLYGAWIEYTRK